MKRAEVMLLAGLVLVWWLSRRQVQPLTHAATVPGTSVNPALAQELAGALSAYPPSTAVQFTAPDGTTVQTNAGNLSADLAALGVNDGSPWRGPAVPTGAPAGVASSFYI